MRPSDGEVDIEAELEAWLHATGPTSKHYERVLAAVRQLRERAEAAKESAQGWKETAERCAEERDAAEKRVADCEETIKRQVRDMGDLEARLSIVRHDRDQIEAERDQLRAQLAKRDEGERRTVFFVEEKQGAYWLNDGPEFSTMERAQEKHEENLNEGFRSRIVEVTEIRRVLSGTGSEGSK